MRKRIKRKIADLHQQPEHVRHRAATFFTIGAGVVIVALWLTVLLPLQLRLQGNNRSSEPRSEEIITEGVNEFQEQGLPADPLPQVGGTQDIVEQDSPFQNPSIPPFNLPTATPQEETLPVTLEEPIESPTP